MKQRILLFLLLTFSLTLFSQDQKDTIYLKYREDAFDKSSPFITDTIIFNSPHLSHILTGTAIMTNTHNQLNAYGYGLTFEKVDDGGCKEYLHNSASRYASKINSVKSNDSNLIVDITIYDNCCYSFLCDISVDTTGTLNLIYYGYGTNCACDCRFNLVYQFSNNKMQGYEKLKQVMINGNPNTMRVIKKK